jgi:DNA-binding transcriptional LysR family regulator
MDLDWLKDFLALAELKSFSRAADARNVTQPAFSRRVRALEDWVGTLLFTRSPQGVALTEAGNHFLPLAAEIMRRLEKARRDTRSAGDRDSEGLSIAATHALSFTFLPGWIRSRLHFRGLGALNLISDSMDGCERIMLSGVVNFLLCHHHPAAPPRFDSERFQSVQIGTDVLVPLCAPAGEGRPVWALSGRHAGPVRLLAYSQASGLGRILSAHKVSSDAVANMQVAFTSHLAAALMTMAREGHGLAWLPYTLAENELTDRRLVRAGPEQFDIPVEIRLFRSPDCRNRTADQLWDAVAVTR